MLALARTQALLAVAWDAKALLATAGAEGQVRLWDAGGRNRGTMRPAREWLYGLAFDADGRLLFTGDWQGRARVFDARARRQLVTFVPSRPAP